MVHIWSFGLGDRAGRWGADGFRSAAAAICVYEKMQGTYNNEWKADEDVKMPRMSKGFAHTGKRRSWRGSNVCKASSAY